MSFSKFHNCMDKNFVVENFNVGSFNYEHFVLCLINKPCENETCLKRNSFKQKIPLTL